MVQTLSVKESLKALSKAQKRKVLWALSRVIHIYSSVACFFIILIGSFPQIFSEAVRVIRQFGFDGGSIYYFHNLAFAMFFISAASYFISLLLEEEGGNKR